MKKILMVLLAGVLLSCTYKNDIASELSQEKEQQEAHYEVQKSESEWKSILDPMQYYVLRQKGTERPFTGTYNKHYKEGVYTCAACQQELFDSDSKFDSGTGWPSFDSGISNKAVGVYQDNTLGMSRTEIVCTRCGGHLGHVFEDGPTDTGLRFCVNSASLGFVPETERK